MSTLEKLSVEYHLKSLLYSLSPVRRLLFPYPSQFAFEYIKVVSNISLYRLSKTCNFEFFVASVHHFDNIPTFRQNGTKPTHHRWPWDAQVGRCILDHNCAVLSTTFTIFARHVMFPCF
jgi:hypothetical protein